MSLGMGLTLERSAAPRAIDLVDIIERAATLEERLTPDFESTSSGAPGEIDERLRKWCSIVAGGDGKRFARRLDWDGLEMEQVRRALGPGRFVGTSRPEWSAILGEVLADLREREAAPVSLESLRQDPVLEASSPVAFEELLLPFVRTARRRLAAELGRAGEPLRADASVCLERGLLRRLGSLADQCVFLHFTVFRSTAQARPLSALGALFEGGRRTAYDAFIGEMYAGGLERLFHDYPVLGRLLATCTRQWVETTAEMVRCLEADRDALAAAFGDGVGLAQLCRVQPDRSDPHYEGRSVAILQFDSGLRLVFKPRGLGLDRAFFQLVAWLNGRGLEPSLREVATLDRGTHGWCEYVDVQPCASVDEVRTFYERAGMLLAVAYAIGGADFHSENVFASGAHPVLIDLEMLMVPTELHGAEDLATHVPGVPRAHSVLGTGLLPFRVPASDRARYEGGLVFREAGELRHRRGWRWTNTDLMLWGEEWVPAQNGRNVPILEGASVDVADYSEELTRGFAKLYRLLIAHRSELLSETGPLASFRGQRSRFLVRNTSSYGVLMRRVRHPEFLRDGVLQSFELEILKSLSTLQPEQAWGWALMRQEAGALVRQDVPAFSIATDAVAIDSHGGGASASPHFVRSGLGTVQSCIGSLDEQGLATQAELIRVALRGSQIKKRRGGPAPRGDEAPLDAGELLAEARGIADTLTAVAAVSADGAEARWTGPVGSRDPALAGAMGDVGSGLFQGQAGIALFFAVLARATREAGDRAAALRAVRPLVATVEHDWPRRLPEIGLGAWAGAGGMVYALVKVGEALEAPELVAAAARAAAAVPPDLIRADREHEVLFGSAGYLLALLALHAARPAADVLEQAHACGRHLLASRIRDRHSGRNAWANLGGEMPTGVPHGSAGIGHALLGLYRATGASEYLDAVLEAREFEQSVFVPESHNWREGPAAQERLPLPNSWCHGATGIGLVRVAGLDVIDTAQARAEAGEAVQATLDVFEGGLMATDTLCCGTLGRAELLLRAADLLGRPELRPLALGGVSRIVRRSRAMLGYRVNGDDTTQPGFFQGLAGMGTSLLRMAGPSCAPFVPLWE